MGVVNLDRERQATRPVVGRFAHNCLIPYLQHDVVGATLALGKQLIGRESVWVGGCVKPAQVPLGEYNGGWIARTPAPRHAIGNGQVS